MAAKATRSGQGSGHGQGQGHLNWDNYNLRGLNASIIVPFFKWPKISREIHFYALEAAKMRSKGLTVHTTSSTTMHMNTTRLVGKSEH